MAISKVVRFEVFKRDGFRCAYCGKEPPQVVLEIDHIEPKSKGGEDEINNLITACFDCNRGKSNVLLSRIPNKIEENYEILKEKEDQLKAHRLLLKKIKNRVNKDINEVNQIFTENYPGYGFTTSFIESTLKRFLQKLSKADIVESLWIAVRKIPDDRDCAVKYFCGICWNKIKPSTDPDYLICKELARHWKNQPRGTGYLPANYLKKMLKKHTAEKIKQAMDEAVGCWAPLKVILGDWQ